MGLVDTTVEDEAELVINEVEDSTVREETGLVPEAVEDGTEATFEAPLLGAVITADELSLAIEIEEPTTPLLVVTAEATELEVVKRVTDEAVVL